MAPVPTTLILYASTLVAVSNAKNPRNLLTRGYVRKVGYIEFPTSGSVAVHTTETGIEREIKQAVADLLQRGVSVIEVCKQNGVVEHAIQPISSEDPRFPAVFESHFNTCHLRIGGQLIRLATFQTYARLEAYVAARPTAGESPTERFSRSNH